MNYLLTLAERTLEPYEQVDTSTLTVEHVMPQSVLTAPAWTDYLDNEGVPIGEAVAVMHTLGNLTLVAGAYNSGNEQPWIRGQAGGAKGSSPLRINNALAHAETWLPADIEARSD